MNDREFKWLKKVDLLELLVSLSRENELLKQQLEEARKTLSDQEINLDEIGSIAEASLHLNGVFQSAQRAADQYLENARRLCEKQERDTQKKIMQMLEETRARCEAMEAEAAARFRQTPHNREPIGSQEETGA